MGVLLKVGPNRSFAFANESVSEFSNAVIHEWSVSRMSDGRIADGVDGSSTIGVKCAIMQLLETA